MLSDGEEGSIQELTTLGRSKANVQHALNAVPCTGHEGWQWVEEACVTHNRMIEVTQAPYLRDVQDNNH